MFLWITIDEHVGMKCPLYDFMQIVFSSLWDWFATETSHLPTTKISRNSNVICPIFLQYYLKLTQNGIIIDSSLVLTSHFPCTFPKSSVLEDLPTLNDKNERETTNNWRLKFYANKAELSSWNSRKFTDYTIDITIVSFYIHVIFRAGFVVLVKTCLFQSI